jgi:hypothetical protein
MPSFYVILGRVFNAFCFSNNGILSPVFDVLVKATVFPEYVMRAYGGMEVRLHAFLNFDTRWRQVVTSAFFSPGKESLVRILVHVGWVKQSSWTRSEVNMPMCLSRYEAKHSSTLRPL